MTQRTDPLAFSLFADNELPFGQQVERYKQFRALMVYSLLFEPVLIVPDVFAINNLNFRRAIKNDFAVSEMIARGHIQFARREEDEQQVSFAELRDRTLEKAKSSPWEDFPVGRYFPYDEYREAFAVDFMDQRGTHQGYLVSNLGKRYTDTWLKKTTPQQLADKLGDVNIAEEVWEAAQKEKESATILTRNFFWQLADRIDARLQVLGRPDTVGHRLKQIATGYYITGLPEEKGGSPLYSDEHSASIDLVRGRLDCLAGDVANEREQLESGISPKELVGALLELTPDDVDELRASDEWQHYRHAIETMRDRGDLVAAYEAYSRRIEEVVMRVVGSNTQPWTQQIDFKIDRKTGRIGWVVMGHFVNEAMDLAINGLLGVAVGSIPMLRCLLQRTFGEDLGNKIRKKTEKAAAKHDQEKKKWQKDMEQRIDEGEVPPDRIEATLNFSEHAHDIRLGIRKR